MSKLFNHGDGANPQAQAVLAYLNGRDGIENSWSVEQKRYIAEPTVARWYNCREQGYVVSMRSKNYDRQINIAFFEHRNTDEICAIEWEQETINPPTLNDIPDGVYQNKSDISKSLNYGKVVEMSEWIYWRLETFWEMTLPKG
jgi:hypothetical protein